MAAEIAKDTSKDVQAPQQDLAKDVQAPQQDLAKDVQAPQQDLQKDAQALQGELAAEAAALQEQMKKEAMEAARKKLEEKLDKYLPESAKGKLKYVLDLKEKAESPEGQKKIERATQCAMAAYYAVQFLGEVVNMIRIILDDSSIKVLNLGRLVISAVMASLQACGAMNFTNKFLQKKNSPMVERATQLHSYGKIAESVKNIPEASSKLFTAIKAGSGTAIIIAAREVAEACGQCATHMKVAADIMKDKMGEGNSGHLAQLHDMVMEFIDQAKKKLGLHKIDPDALMTGLDTLEDFDQDELLNKALEEDGLGNHADALKGVVDDTPEGMEARKGSELIKNLRSGEDGAKGVSDSYRNDIKSVPSIAKDQVKPAPATSTRTGDPLKAMGTVASAAEPKSKEAHLPEAAGIPRAKHFTPESLPVDPSKADAPKPGDALRKGTQDGRNIRSI